MRLFLFHTTLRLLMSLCRTDEPIALKFLQRVIGQLRSIQMVFPIIIPYIRALEDVANVQVINLPIDRLLINIALHDSSGRLIATFSPQTVFSNGVYEIPVATLRDGLYNISLETNSDMSIILSLIVKN